MVASRHDPPVGAGVSEEDAPEGELIVCLVAVPEPGVVTPQEVDVVGELEERGESGWEPHLVVTDLEPVRGTGHAQSELLVGVEVGPVTLYEVRQLPLRLCP